jgi:FkbM family methyltransferase
VKLERVATPLLGRDVFLRPGTSDAQVWADTFTGLYHVPPATMPVPGRVLDLGANIGLTAAHYQALWPDAHVVAVEMDAGNASVARLNFDGAVHQAAVAARIGQSYYSAVASQDAYTAVGAIAGRAVMGPVVPVQSATLAGLLRVFGPLVEGSGAGADFVKMDIEGSEWEVLQHSSSSWAPFVRHLLVELHPVGTLPDNDVVLVRLAIDELVRLGFHAVPHDRHPRAVWAIREGEPA